MSDHTSTAEQRLADLIKKQAITLIDQQAFTRLFTELLGWNRPARRRPIEIQVNEHIVPVTQVADYKGMGVWHCPELPDRTGQLVVDKGIAKHTTERLIIFTTPTEQQWRWPRYVNRRGTANPRLVNHPHTVGQPNPELVERLEQINIPPGSDVTVPELLSRMRDAFDREAEKASVRAARVMGALYEKLADADVPDTDASIVLARILFLMFGDDTNMWTKNLFHDYLTDHTRPDGTDLTQRLQDVFTTADTPERERPAGLPEVLAGLPYINGGIFAEPVSLPSKLPADLRAALIEACRFDWGQISPAVFGSMFQTVKSSRERRELGEHYTTETNILKTIRPLFLDELHDKLEAAWDNKGQLTKLRNSLADYRYLDPACGCGNFLIVAYRELRALELEILKRRRDLDDQDRKTNRRDARSQLSFDATEELNVTIDQFYGIEIGPWPAQIAETAMFLIDHQANQAMETELGQAPHRLPIEITAHITIGNALRTDWAELVPPTENSLVFGNPPFKGARDLSKQQKEDMALVWGKQRNSNFDFVTCWYRKALDYYGPDTDGRWAFVSTNSICQGEPVADLWQPILDQGWRCRFAHRSFQWVTEAADGAAVHVSIIGFDRHRTKPKPTLWAYPEGGHGTATKHVVPNINPYLAAGQPVLVRARRKPLNPALPEPAFGHRAIDGGNLIVEARDYDAVASDPIAAKYLRPCVGAKQLMHNQPRWCLWLTRLEPTDLDASPILRERVDAVRQFRLHSRNPQTIEAAETPHLFGIMDNTQLANTTNYLAIPRVVSERRRYFAAAYYQPQVVCSDAAFTAPDPDGFALGILSSTMFITWMKTIGGRLESRIRFSKTFSYNTFPLPALSREQYEQVTRAARSVLEARDNHQDKSLAELYDPDKMPIDLLAEHQEVDAVIDPIFGLDQDPDLTARQTALFEHYVRLTAGTGTYRAR